MDTPFNDVASASLKEAMVYTAALFDNPVKDALLSVIPPGNRTCVLGIPSPPGSTVASRIVGRVSAISGNPW